MMNSGTPLLALTILAGSGLISAGFAQEEGELEQVQGEQPGGVPSDPDRTLPSKQGSLLDALRHQRQNFLARRRIGSSLTSPSSVTVIPEAILRQSGARHLSDALRLAPGVEVQRVSATDSNVSVRGYNDAASTGQGILANVDGRQVYNEFLGNVLWDTLPIALDDVQRIEVLRGPGASVLGPNAMHGAVDILTHSPLDYSEDTAELSASAGAYASSRARLVHVRKGDSSGLKTTLRWDDIASFERTTGETWEKKSIELRYATELGSGADDVLDLTFGHSDQNIELLIPSIRVSADQLLAPAWFDSGIRETFAKADLDLGTIAGDDAELRASVSWTGFDGDLQPDAVYTPFDLDLDTLDAEVVHSRRFGDHVLTGGAGLRHATFVTATADIAEGRHGTSLVWGFLQDDVQLGDALSFTGGLRVDQHSEAGTHASPRAALVWKIDEGNALRASYGTGYRNPSLRELWFDMPITIPPGVEARVVGNRDLDAEQMRSFELGWRGQQNDSWNASVTAFYNLVDDLVTFGAVGDLTFAPQNNVDERTYGFEVDAHWVAPTPWISVFANYAFTIREIHEDRRPEYDPDSDGRNPLAPLNKANLGVLLDGRTAERGPRAMLWANWFDRTEVYDETINSYFLLNASVTYDFEFSSANASAFIEGFNLLDDDDHKEHPQGQAFGAMVMAGMSVSF